MFYNLLRFLRSIARLSLFEKDGMHRPLFPFVLMGSDSVRFTKP